MVEKSIQNSNLRQKGTGYSNSNQNVILSNKGSDLRQNFRNENPRVSANTNFHVLMRGKNNNITLTSIPCSLPII